MEPTLFLLYLRFDYWPFQHLGVDPNVEAEECNPYVFRARRPDNLF